MGFTCSTCGRYHEEELRDVRTGLPDEIFALAFAQEWFVVDGTAVDDRFPDLFTAVSTPVP